MDSLVSCVIAAEEATASDHLDRDLRMRAAATSLLDLAASWAASRSASALLAVGELVTPMHEIVRASLACARLAERACPSLDPEVVDALDVLAGWLAGEASEHDRSVCAAVLRQRYNGRPCSELPPAAWATYCATSVGLSVHASAWYHASAAARSAEEALRRGGNLEPEHTVAREVKRYLTCPSIEQLASAIIDQNFRLD